MIAHVAEASENSGRVILSLAAAEPLFTPALDAALHVTRSFNAGLDSLVIEDASVAAIERFAFVREVPFCGAPGGTQSASHDASAIKALHGKVELLASEAEVPCRQRTLDASLVEALKCACQENGRWNVAVLGGPVSAMTEREVANIFETVDDVTAVVAVGRHAQRAAGPAVAIVERLDHLEAMLRAAERLGGEAGGYVLLFGAEDPALEDQARLILGINQQKALLAKETFGSPGVLAAMLERLKVHTVVAVLGGALLPSDGGLQEFSKLHDGPLFLVRSGS